MSSAPPTGAIRRSPRKQSGATADGALVDVGADVPTTCAAGTLVASASWDKSDTFVTDGHEVFWRGGYQSSPVFAVGVDGTNRRSFTVTGCPDLQGASRLYAGYIYFQPLIASARPSSLNRISTTATTSTPCEEVLPPAASVVSYFIDPADNALLVATEGQQLLRVDFAKFRSTVVADPSSLRVGFADATYLYGVDYPMFSPGAYRVVRFDRASKITTVLSPILATPHVLYADDTFVYYDNQSSLFKLPKNATGSSTPVRVPGPQGAWRIYADGSDAVYWNLEKPNLYKVPFAGGPVTVISTGPLIVRGLTWDASRYYFMESAGPNPWLGPFKIWSIPK